jgi:hypothetical protein
MEKEIPLMALAYIERLLTKVGVLMNHWNWRRIVLITLIEASKVWDDDSLENVHFPKVMNDISIKEVNGLERIFVEFIDYQLAIRVNLIILIFRALITLNTSLSSGHLQTKMTRESYPVNHYRLSKCKNYKKRIPLLVN